MRPFPRQLPRTPQTKRLCVAPLHAATLSMANHLFTQPATERILGVQFLIGRAGTGKDGSLRPARSARALAADPLGPAAALDHAAAGHFSPRNGDCSPVILPPTTIATVRFAPRCSAFAVSPSKSSTSVEGGGETSATPPIGRTGEAGPPGRNRPPTPRRTPSFRRRLRPPRLHRKARRHPPRTPRARPHGGVAAANHGGPPPNSTPSPSANSPTSPSCSTPGPPHSTPPALSISKRCSNKPPSPPANCPKSPPPKSGSMPSPPYTALETDLLASLGHARGQKLTITILADPDSPAILRSSANRSSQ